MRCLYACVNGQHVGGLGGQHKMTLGKGCSAAAQGAELSPEELTRLNMDKSALLQQLIQEYGGDALMLLGELQVSSRQAL